MSPVPKSSAGSCRLTKGSTLYMFLKTKQIRKKNKIVTYKILKIFNLKQIKAPGLLQSSWRWERRGGGLCCCWGEGCSYKPCTKIAHSREICCNKSHAKATAACLLYLYLSFSFSLLLSSFISFYHALLGRRHCLFWLSV